MQGVALGVAHDARQDRSQCLTLGALAAPLKVVCRDVVYLAEWGRRCLGQFGHAVPVALTNTPAT